MAKRNPTCGCGEQGLCNLAELDCHPCCRCIPQRLCATLDAGDCDCDGRTSFMELNEDDEYTGAISCGGETMDLRVLLHHENDRCYWRVISEAFYIDELFEIGSGGQSCEDPSLLIDAPFYECPGTVTISRQLEEILDLVEDENGCLRPYCGECRCVCKTLCVTRSDCDYGSEPGEELEWDGSGWGDIRLERDEYTGECIARVEGDDRFEPIIVDECGNNIDLAFENDYGDYIYGTCKKCACRARRCPCCGPGWDLVVGSAGYNGIVTPDGSLSARECGATGQLFPGGSFNCEMIDPIIVFTGQIDIYCENNQWFAEVSTESRCNRIYEIEVICPECDCDSDDEVAYGYANFDVEFCCSISDPEHDLRSYIVNVELFIFAPCKIP